MPVKRMLMSEFAEACPGALLAIDFAQGAKVGRPVRVMVELKEQRLNVQRGRVEWTGRVVKCSPVLASRYLGHDLWVQPENHIAVVG